MILYVSLCKCEIRPADPLNIDRPTITERPTPLPVSYEIRTTVGPYMEKGHPSRPTYCVCISNLAPWLERSSSVF